MTKRIKAEDLQFKGYDYICEELENCDDTIDLSEEFGTRIEDGTVSADDVRSYDADHHHYQIKRVIKPKLIR